MRNKSFLLLNGSETAEVLSVSVEEVKYKGWKCFLLFKFLPHLLLIDTLSKLIIAHLICFK